MVDGGSSADFSSLQRCVPNDLLLLRNTTCAAQKTSLRKRRQRKLPSRRRRALCVSPKLRPEVLSVEGLGKPNRGGVLILECHQWGRDLRCSAVHLPPVSWCPLQRGGGGILQGVKGICCLTSFLALLRRLGLHS